MNHLFSIIIEYILVYIFEYSIRIPENYKNILINLEYLLRLTLI